MTSIAQKLAQIETLVAEIKEIMYGQNDSAVPDTQVAQAPTQEPLNRWTELKHGDIIELLAPCRNGAKKGVYKVKRVEPSTYTGPLNVEVVHEARPLSEPHWINCQELIDSDALVRR